MNEGFPQVEKSKHPTMATGTAEKEVAQALKELAYYRIIGFYLNRASKEHWREIITGWAYFALQIWPQSETDSDSEIDCVSGQSAWRGILSDSHS